MSDMLLVSPEGHTLFCGQICSNLPAKVLVFVQTFARVRWGQEYAKGLFRLRVLAFSFSFGLLSMTDGRSGCSAVMLVNKKRNTPQLHAAKWLDWQTSNTWLNVTPLKTPDFHTDTEYHKMAPTEDVFILAPVPPVPQFPQKSWMCRTARLLFSVGDGERYYEPGQIVGGRG